jgi:Na+-transporting NADH:ubiquinone oxidoreductase subunit NqrE
MTTNADTVGRYIMSVITVIHLHVSINIKIYLNITRNKCIITIIEWK